MFKELYSALPLYGQVLLTIGIVIVGVTAAWKGFHENAKKHEDAHDADPRVIPMWLMVGPMHDALQSMHDVAESNRTQVAILRDIDKTLDNMDRGQQYTHYVLEAILRNQEMGVSLTPPPPRYTRR